MLHELITATKILLAPEALVVAAGPHLPQVTLHVDLKLRVPEVKLLVADVADINLDPGMNIWFDLEYVPLFLLNKPTFFQTLKQNIQPCLAPALGVGVEGQVLPH